MSQQKQIDKQQKSTKKHYSKNEPARNPATEGGDATLNRVLKLVSAGKHQEALDLLRNAGRDTSLRNARGVCLLRMGRFEEAVHVLRELVLKPGCTWVRPDLPIEYKTNYATALLLSGNTSGCTEILGEINDESHPNVQRLRAAIRAWVRTLSLWQRLNWWVGKIAPDNKPAAIDFEPGSFGIDVTPPENIEELRPEPPLGTAA